MSGGRGGSVRRVVAWNLAVLLIGLVGVEVLARIVVADQRSAGFRTAETIRQASVDAPDRYDEAPTYSGGLRTTLGQPVHPVRRVFALGGSTTLCAEVPDGLTWPSQLQALLNGSRRGIRVENLGQSAATLADRVEFLRASGSVAAGDVIILYGGVNEAGLSFTQRDLPAQIIRRFPRLGTALARAARYSRLADLAFRRFVFGAVAASPEGAGASVDSFRGAIRDARELARTRGARIEVVLQPHLYTRTPRTAYDASLAAAFSPALESAVSSAYADIRRMLDAEISWLDARSVMNALERSPYYDWHHVDGRGNAAIAEYLYEHVDWDVGS